MNTKEREWFRKELLDFMALFREKLSRPYEDSLQSLLSPLQFYSLCIVRAAGGVTMTELANRMSMTKQHVTKIVDRLEELKLVERQNNPADRRVAIITMRPEACAFFDGQVMNSADQLCCRIESLEPDDVKNFKKALTVLNDVLRKVPQQPETQDPPMKKANASGA